MKKVVVFLVCDVVLLVGDKSGIELPSFGAKKDYEQGEAFYDNKEYDKAAELYKKACDGGDMRGCFNLGTMYANGNGVQKDFSKAAQLFKKACDGGSMYGCYNLGVMYAKGSGVEKDFSKAAELLKKACDGGETNGCRGLDIIYANGNGVEKTR